MPIFVGKIGVFFILSLDQTINFLKNVIIGELVHFFS